MFKTKIRAIPTAVVAFLGVSILATGLAWGTESPTATTSAVTTDPSIAGLPATRLTDFGPVFNTLCPLSHVSNDDPIVFPGQQGAAHQHAFFGSRSADFDATTQELIGGSTTCKLSGDTAAYWIPTMTVDGKLVQPFQLRAYYYLNTIAKDKVQPMPSGLKMLAGDPKATASQNPNIVQWLCRQRTAQATGYPTLVPGQPSCTSSQYLSLGIRFPDCWDGRNLDSPNHRSHVAYSGNKACPSTHPVKMMKLRMSITYPTSGGSGVAIAAGSKHSMHADFWNTWKPVAFQAAIDKCIKTTTRCSTLRD